MGGLHRALDVFVAASRRRTDHRRRRRIFDIKGPLGERRLQHPADYAFTRKPAGRLLDCLMQELNREANTLSSKSQDLETTRSAVDMKVLIAQLREQVQNIE